MKLKSLSDLQQLLPASAPPPRIPDISGHDGRGKEVHISLDMKGRKGKSVTIISGLQHNPATMKDIARILKEHCGAGGTVKNGVIELQGDQRSRVSEKLQKMNYIIG